MNATAATKKTNGKADIRPLLLRSRNLEADCYRRAVLMQIAWRSAGRAFGPTRGSDRPPAGAILTAKKKSPPLACVRAVLFSLSESIFSELDQVRAEKLPRTPPISSGSVASAGSLLADKVASGTNTPKNFYSRLQGFCRSLYKVRHVSRGTLFRGCFDVAKYVSLFLLLCGRNCCSYLFGSVALRFCPVNNF